MKKRRTMQGSKRFAGWRLRVLLASLLVASGVVAWGFGGGGGAPGGTPRLAVDRTDIDVGRFAFDVPARAVFTLRNEGDGLLKVVDLPPVKAVQGC